MSEKFIARKGDKHDCPLHGEGTITTGYDKYLVEGLPIARVGGKIISAASTTTAESNKILVHVGANVKVKIGKNVHLITFILTLIGTVIWFNNLTGKSGGWLQSLKHT